MNHMVNALVVADFSLFMRYVIVMVCVMSLTIFPNYFFRNQNERLFRGLQAYFYNTYISRYFRIDNNRADAHGTGFYNNVIQK